MRRAGLGRLRRWRGIGGLTAAAVAVAALTTPVLAQTPSPAAITVDPVCGPPALPGPPQRYALTVRGEHFNPFAAVLVSFDFAAGGRPETFPARTDGFGRFEVAVNPLHRPVGTYVVRADDLRQREASTTFTVPCTSSPALRLEPPIGPPGFVTMAVGTGFPPGAPVRLTWQPGLTASASTTTAGAGGTFRVPVLVFHRDRLGPRDLQAAPAGGVPFATVTADFLVVPGKLQPGDFVDRR